MADLDAAQSDMILRQPELEPYRHGMPPGLDEPARARGRSTSSRTAGTRSIACTARMDAQLVSAIAVSSGCVRLLVRRMSSISINRVPSGSPIIVLQS
jgi:lipoprotein-anchoring transpeptidase ErfK/SrfK